MAERRLVRIQEKGQVTLPAAVRKQLGLKKGDLVAVTATPEGVLITPQEVVATRAAHPRPRGIYWDLLRPLKINAIPLLRKRMRRGGAGTPSPRRL